MDRSNPPASDQVELSLLGPGIGEAVVVHLGAGDWIVVDSCVARDTGRNAVLQYFEELGIDPAEAVRAVVASHAHNDHVGGISEIVEACPNSDFVCPEASTSEEFFALLEIDEQFVELRQAVYTEFQRVHSILESRRSGRVGRYPYVWAIEKLPLFTRAASAGIPSASVLAIAPSHTAATLAKQSFAAKFPAAGSRPKVPQRDPNTLAVALWIEVGEVRMLLGSDLERGPGDGCGWNRVLVSNFDRTGKASAFKVPHHGSPDAHHLGCWQDLLSAEPLALVTPYRTGTTARPSPEDQERICRLTRRAYVSAAPKFPLRTEHGIRAAASSLTAVSRNVREADGLMGHIRCRSPWTDADNWTVELFSPARELC